MSNGGRHSTLLLFQMILFEVTKIKNSAVCISAVIGLLAVWLHDNNRVRVNEGGGRPWHLQYIFLDSADSLLSQSMLAYAEHEGV